jgi:hypothetical protein
LTAVTITLAVLLSFPFPLAQHHEPPSGLTVYEGRLSQYAEQPSIDTLQYRQQSGQIPYGLPENVVLMAVADCEQIGRQGLISINGSEWEPLYAFDCAGSNKAYRWLVDNGFLGEIDFWSAVRHDVVCLCAIDDGRVVWFD